MGSCTRGWLILVATAFASPAFAADRRIGQGVERTGDEIVVCGRFYHTTAPVVLWMDRGGYDAYRVERRFAPFEESNWDSSRSDTLRHPNRFAQRRVSLSREQIEQVRGGGWDLPLLQSVVDQFVIHYDARGTSRECFRILHDVRGLSVQFMLDLDGTIYQTLDAKEGAWHATIVNGRSIGIEIANIGAYPVTEPAAFDRWYARDPSGRMRITLPASESLRNRQVVPRPIRDEPLVGTIQGRSLRQYDLTPEQYDSLIKLTATLCELFPKIRCDYPRDRDGHLIPRKLPDEDLKRYQGILGHYHVQTNKVDPGPAFQWDRLIEGARNLITR
jgi:N-acetyl-anhydromuramyl-L-alanine amidase AmpD